MKKESDFVIYCMERYRYFKGLSGAEAAKIYYKIFRSPAYNGRPLYCAGY